MRTSARKILILFCLLLCMALSACSRQERQPFTVSGFYFDTFVSLTLYEDNAKTREAAEAFLHSCERYDRLFSKTDPESDIWRINHAQSDQSCKEAVVSSETAVLLQDALAYHTLTGGAVNPALGSVTSLWDFHGNDDPAGQSRVPSPEALEAALAHTDPYGIQILPSLSGDEDRILRTEPGLQIDPGFLAKGYIADRLREDLLSRGIDSGIINLGGNVVVLGNKPDGSSYNVGIEKPFSRGSALYTIRAADTSVVTSGVYERYFIENGRLWHHILDPHTGYSISGGLLSVTVVCAGSEKADALATACVVLGLEEGMKLIEETEGTEAMFLDENMVPHLSSGFPELNAVVE